MSGNIRRLVPWMSLVVAGLAVVVLVRDATRAADAAPSAKPVPADLKSKVVTWDEARANVADWGEMRRYFTGTTRATQNVLVAVAIVQPGKAVHKAHRHAEEEYLVIVEGTGTWSLDGKEFPAKRGDILYVEPWVYHGTTNTGTEPLIFVVVRYNGKGVKVPPKPDDRPNEQE